MVTIDDFKKVEIRIGTVLSAERVPDTDKLLKLSVDVGEETPRQIVSGIAEHVTPEEIIGEDGRGIEVKYHLEPIPEDTQKGELEVKVDDPEGKTSYL